MNSKLSLALLYSISATSGLLFTHLGVPLAWMIGPLTSTAALTASGVLDIRVPTMTRPFGQIVVATFIGAHFSPGALHSLLRTAPLLITISLYVLVASIIVAHIQKRIFGTDFTTSFLSVVPTSPVEAGVLAERFNRQPANIIFAQTVRIALVVVVVPFIFYSADMAQLPTFSMGEKQSTIGLIFTLSGAVIGPLAFRFLGLTNPFFLGPLFVATLLSALAIPTYTIPIPLLAAAQIILGTWLGSCFRRELFKDSATLISSTLLTSTSLLALCLAGAWVLAHIFGQPLTTIILGSAPGGVTEMALTTGVLGQDVALVTAMHLTRIFIIMPSVGWITAIMSRNDPQ